MRKSLVFLLLMLVLTAKVTFAEDKITANVSYSPEKNEVTIDAKTEAGLGEISFMIYKINSEALESHKGITQQNVYEKLVSIGTVTPQNNRFVLTKKLPDSVLNGWYQIAFGADASLITNEKLHVYIPSENEMLDMKREFGAATQSNISTVVDKYTVDIPILGIDINDAAYIANKSQIQSMFVTEKDEMEITVFASVGDIQNLFGTTTAICILNNSADKAGCIESYNKYFGLDLANEEYQAAKEAVIALMFKQTEAADGIKSVSEIKTSYKKALMLSKLNKASREEIEMLLLQNRDIIGTLDYRGQNPYNVVKALWKQNYQTTEELLAAFNQSVSTLVNSAQQNFGGGGSGGGGSSTKTPSLVVQPAGASQTLVTSKYKNFDDLDGYSWAVLAIDSLYEENVISGYGNRTFMPENNIKREEFAKMFVEAMKLEAVQSENAFSDVDQNGWYYSYVLTANANSLMNGVGEASFGVGNNMTRQEVATVIYRYLENNEIALNSKNTVAEFADASDIAEYAKEAVYKMAEYGIMSGRGQNNFAPEENISRAEMAVVIYRLLLEMEG